MKLQRSTLILLLVALGLSGAVYVFEIKETEKQEQVAAQKEQIFTFSADDVQSFTVTTSTQTITIERVEENSADSLSPWKLINPLQALANPASVNLLLNQLVNSQTDPKTNTGLRQLQISEIELSDYGLENPQTTVEVTLKDNKTHRLIFGKPDFNGRSIYSQIDPKSTNEKPSILVIPIEILTAIEQPLEDWKMPENTSEIVEPDTDTMIPDNNNSESP
ncbi:MAG: DUF4340 domain-containing protein [Microcoleaceae cyanobacterium]